MAYCWLEFIQLEELTKMNKIYSFQFLMIICWIGNGCVLVNVKDLDLMEGLNFFCGSAVY